MATDFESDDDDYDGEGLKIVINVGGTRHETKVETLLSRPGTRLSYLGKRHHDRVAMLAAAADVRRGSGDGGAGGCGGGGGEKKEWGGGCKRKEYFFDRHPGVFTSIIDYYRSGELHVPLDVCGAVVKRELDYWQLDDGLIEPCCWTIYSQFIDNQKTLTDFNLSIQQENDIIEELRTVKKGWKRNMMHIWMILDHPRYSKLAMGYAVTSFAFVLASITGFCIETLPVMSSIKNVTRECWYDNVISTTAIRVPHFFLECLDYICTVFFTVELVIRIVFAPCKKTFFRSLMNVIDIVALLPLYVQFLLEFLDWQKCLRSHRAVVELIFILRIIRIFRIFHLVKHYKALKILVHAIRASIQELLMLSIFLFIAMLVFSTIIYYAERPVLYSDTPSVTSRFQTIPTGFWYSIITMTTVGYGDVYPQTTLGCIMGALCALCGVLLVALTIPVMSNNFALFYMHARTRDENARKEEDDDDEEADGEGDEAGNAAAVEGRMMDDGQMAVEGRGTIGGKTGRGGGVMKSKLLFRHRPRHSQRHSQRQHQLHQQQQQHRATISGGTAGTLQEGGTVEAKKRILVSQDSMSTTDESGIMVTSTISRAIDDSPAK